MTPKALNAIRKPDYALLVKLTDVKRHDVTHSFKGKGEVCNLLSKKTGCLALLDEDPTSPQPSYLKQFSLDNSLTNPLCDIKVLFNSKHRNRIILLYPKLEDWIVKAAREAGLDLKDYGLPNDPNRLHREINLSLDRYEKLLDALIPVSVRLKVMRRLLGTKI